MLILKQQCLLLWMSPDPEAWIEAAARTCYQSHPKGSKGDLIRKCIKNGHHSVLEHSAACLRFIVDRGISHEMVRHRLCAISQESTRYCNYGKDSFSGEISVIEPPDLTIDQRMYWRESCILAEKNYMYLIKSGLPPQLARSVLPTCLKTDIVITANLREWRHIFDLRTAPNAHPQIQEVMFIALKLLAAKCPNVFHDFGSRLFEHENNER